MQDKPLAASTIKTRFNNVRSVLKAAKRDKVLGEDPTERITLPRRRRADADPDTAAGRIAGVER
ncbi:MAG: hypothetical protein ACOH2Q_17175 [Rhodococcus sp. (in: high G+C Gram-positive bacteria)]